MEAGERDRVGVVATKEVAILAGSLLGGGVWKAGGGPNGSSTTR